MGHEGQARLRRNRSQVARAGSAAHMSLGGQSDGGSYEQHPTVSDGVLPPAPTFASVLHRKLATHWTDFRWLV